MTEKENPRRNNKYFDNGKVKLGINTDKMKTWSPKGALYHIKLFLFFFFHFLKQFIF